MGVRWRNEDGRKRLNQTNSASTTHYLRWPSPTLHTYIQSNGVICFDAFKRGMDALILQVILDVLEDVKC